MNSSERANAGAVRRVVIAGGGTAGWMAAAAITKLIGRNLEVTLIESDAVPTIGVGEATIPTLLTINRLLQIPEPEFLHAVKGTFKLGIQFEGWRKAGHAYIHSFGETGQGCWAAGFHHFWLKGLKCGLSRAYGDYCAELQAAEQGRFAVLSNPKINYAYHLDAGRYAGYLRRLAEAEGAVRLEGKIASVNCDPESGWIQSLGLESGQVVEGDLFLDCTGFRALLIEQALKTGFDDWSHWLPCNAAQAVQVTSTQPAVPYTRAIARRAGWQWKIPLQHRVGSGLVYCADFMSDDEAATTLLANIDGERLLEPRVIKYRTGQRKVYWNRNCIAVGLSSGFVEPLESTSIHFIQNSILWLLLMFPHQGITEPIVAEYNAVLKREAANIRDFIVMHYHLTERDDSEFWKYCRTMTVPDSLSHRLALFRESGRVFKPQDDVFAENSWVQVMMGQGIIPQQYHPIVDMMSDDELGALLGSHRDSVRQLVSKLPPHDEFVTHYCQQGTGAGRALAGQP